MPLAVRFSSDAIASPARSTRITSMPTKISPRSRKNPPKDEADKARRTQRDDELKAEIAGIEARLAAGGLKAQLKEVGPVAAANVLDYFASPVGQATLKRIRDLKIKGQD